jgi:type 1 glutamine amidotransferase/DNA-binding beta-propeller fold protein YncE
MNCRSIVAPVAFCLLAAPLQAQPPALPGHAASFLDHDLQQPFAVDFDAAGRAYIAEMAGNRVSVLDEQGRLRVLAGTGEKGFSGDGGPAAEARFDGPHHLLVGPDGALYVADTWNNCVRRVDLETGIVTRFAGTGEKGFSGDGGPASEARFNSVFNLAFRGGLLYLTDLGNRRVRAVDLKTGLVRTVAGSGEKGVPKDGGRALEEPLVDPRAIALDPWGNLYICERAGHALRVVDQTGRIRTVAGTGEKGYSGDGGPAREARLDGPKHLFAEPNGDVLISDTENHVIRRYSPADGTIRLLIGTGKPGATGLPGAAAGAELNRPHGAQVHPRTGEIYVSDSANNRVVRIGRKRRLLAVGAASGWQHESVSDALAALAAIGRESGLWETTVRTDVQLVTRRKLKDNAKNLDHFDALFFYTCGDLPLDDEQKQALLAFVRDEGRAFLGAHSATVAEWPAFVEMIGGRFDSHPWDQLEAVVKVEDRGFPAVRHFPESFRLFDEFYQVRDFSRAASRVLMSLDLASVDRTREGVRQDDAPIAWTRSYGKGRVFYSSLGHPRASWARTDMRLMWLEAAKWAMGIE